MRCVSNDFSYTTCEFPLYYFFICIICLCKCKYTLLNIDLEIHLHVKAERKNIKTKSRFNQEVTIFVKFTKNEFFKAK